MRAAFRSRLFHGFVLAALAICISFSPIAL